MEQGKKKENGKNVLIVILVLIVIVLTGLVGWGLGKKHSNVEQKKNEEIPEKPREENQQEKTEMMELFKSIEEDYDNFEDLFPLENIDKISNQRLLAFAFTKTEGNWGTPKTATELENIVHKYFGKDAKINHEDLLCNFEKIALYKYDASKQVYSINENHPGHGGGLGGGYYTKSIYKSGIKQNDTYEIKTKILYSWYCSDVCAPKNAYAASKEDVENKNFLIGDPSSMESIEVTEEDIKEFEDKLKTVTYTFVKDSDGNYGLTKVTIE